MTKKHTTLEELKEEFRQLHLYLTGCNMDIEGFEKLDDIFNRILQARDEEAYCHCKDVDFGEYTNAVSMCMPFGNKDVSIDCCIATEIAYLWHQGVETLNSCCGHGKNEATVIVKESGIERMKELGYELSTEYEYANPHMTFRLKGANNLKPRKTNKMYNQIHYKLTSNYDINHHK